MAKKRKKKQFDWADLPEEELLDMRFCDLGLEIKDTPLESRTKRLQQEIDRRGINFKPHFWLSDEWFSPDGIPGIAIPFYLAHPRLQRLERKYMLEVEGGDETWCMKILRHETGHCLDTAFRLHRRRKWRELFGKHTEPYPEFYRPKPYSRSYVLHLDSWYAQAHPSEDFAETFAVWLRPRSPWRTQYTGWPAFRKLDYVNQVMRELRGSKPVVVSRKRLDSLSTIRKTLREHYEEKRNRYGIEHPHVYDRDLQRVFSTKSDVSVGPTAASLLRKHRASLRKRISQWTGEYQYTIDQVLSEMILRCQELKLRVDRPPEEVQQDVLVLLSVITVNYLHDGHHRVAL